MMKSIMSIICFFLFFMEGKARQSGGDTILVSIENAKFNSDTLMPNVTFLSISFLVNKLNGIDKIYILAGDSVGSSSVLNEELTVKNDNGDFYYYLDERNNMIRNWAGHVHLSVVIEDSDIPHTKWITIYAQKKTGEKTNNVTYLIHQ